MIAASDPQEYVPSGRRQALRHPGPLDVPHRKFDSNEDFLLDKFEKVSLKEKKQTEWWLLRKATTKLLINSNNDNATENEHIKSNLPPNSNTSHTTDFPDDSISFKSPDVSHKIGKRISDSNLTRFSNKRFSSDSNLRIDSKSSITNKSLNAGLTQNYPPSKLKAKIDIGYLEDELYVKGNTAIWSRGLVNNFDDNDNGRKTICSYTSPLPIKHALWCTFYCERPNYDTGLFELNNRQEGPNGTPVTAVCIIDSHNIRIFTPKGEDFVIAIPFQIGRVWTTRYGIFIEKEANGEVESFQENRATLYSMAYPLDEVCPVAVSYGSIQVMNNHNLSVVYTGEDPSICMVYDSQTKQHSIYQIRKVKMSEKLEFVDKLDNTPSQSTTSQSNRLKSRLSMWENLKNSNNLAVPNTLNSRPASVASFFNLQLSRSHSSMAAMSRCQSPAPSSVGSPWLLRQSRLSTSVQYPMPPNRSFFDYSKSMSHLHSSPTVCLDYIWTDHVSLSNDVTGPATKVFLCDDLVGQWYLCYILPSKCQLVIVRIDFSNYNVGFGLLTSISAKDATAVPHLHMLAILEHSGSVTLYSGLTIVGKLHIGGTLVQHTPSPYVRRSLPQFNSPFPRRSSLLPNCKTGELKFDEHLLSPVLPEISIVSRTNNILQLNAVNFNLDCDTSKTVLIGLLDSIENRMTLKYSDGTYYRITLPIVASAPLVENCLDALRQCLTKDAAMIVLTRWYASRNSLGSQDVNVEEEWEMLKGVLLELLGYDDEFFEESDLSKDCPVTPSCNPKRPKQSSLGSDEDWIYLLNSEHQNKLSDLLIKTIKIPYSEKHCRVNVKRQFTINVKSVLFPQIKFIHYCLHLLYEDLKLDILRRNDLRNLAQFLNKLSNDLGLLEYSVHYWKDFPDYCLVQKSPSITQSEMKNINNLPQVEGKPISIMEFIYNLIRGETVDWYPYLKNVNKRSKDIIQICGLITRDVNSGEIYIEDLIKTVEIPSTSVNESERMNCKYLGIGTIPEQATLLMTERKLTIRDIETLPLGLYLLFYGNLWKCRENPPSNWPAEAYYLLWRDDLALQAEKMEKKLNEVHSNKPEMDCSSQLQEIIPSVKQCDGEQLDGMEDLENHLMKLRFPEDVRVGEARKMLQSSKPVPIVLVQRPDVSDHDFIEEQEKHLYAICTRTMALPTGRGMLTLRTSTPVITEPLQTPQLCLTGKAPPKGTTVELNHIDTPSNMNLWPLFHNGVANGLRITPDAHNIDNTWIIFNKPKGSLEQQMEHAGFLMALGLNGHLKNLEVLSTYDYLVKLHEMTSIGILLGLSAAFRGTSNCGLTKMLSIHVEALLPPTSMELDVPQNLQVAALLGVGLVYQGTAHRHIIEVLLSEIGRPPGPEMENSVDRESYSLAAGLSLGLVTLKQGAGSSGLSDLNVPDTLHYYMIGGNRRPLTGSQKDKYKVPSFQIREGSSVNLDVTAPGATIALGLMYLGTGNKAVADWMTPPETQYLLDFVRPDFLMFRILSRALIMWDNIEPSKDWIENQVPATIRPHCMVKPSTSLDIDYEAMNQAYCNIVTGACFALGLKYAGSADEDAFETLLHFCHMFTRLTVKSIAELAGKPTVETCLNVLLLSAAMIMAGTGNLDIMRLVRLLRRRVGVASSAVVTYGSHLAIHMALGLLFLGGGRYTLSNSPANVAALICAFYPKFPTHSNDNRYHLQAFRHLYVLAVEPRLVIPKDVHSGKNCYASLKIVQLDGTISRIKGPGIIPDLNALLKVAVDDERYWPVVFERGRNWDLLIQILSTTGFIEVKQRAGCLSYIVDKFGYHSQLARTLTQSGVVPWNPAPSSIVSFTFDKSVMFFCDHFLQCKNQEPDEMRWKQMITKITYDAVIRDKLIVVPVLTSLIKTIQDIKMSSSSSAITVWQIKLISAQILTRPLSSNLISPEVILALEQELIGILELWEDRLKVPLQFYMNGAELNFQSDILRNLAIYVTYYNLAFKTELFQDDFLKVLCNLRNCSIRVIEKIHH